MLRQIAGADQNGAVQFGVAGKISSPYLLLDGLAVRSKYFQSILAASLEVTVQRVPSNSASHDGFAILAIEKDHVAPEDQTLHGRGKAHVMPLQAPLYAADDKGCERMDVHLDAGAVQRALISFAVHDANDRPGITA